LKSCDTISSYLPVSGPVLNMCVSYYTTNTLVAVCLIGYMRSIAIQGTALDYEYAGNIHVAYTGISY